jgi:hypothetical protein
MLECRTNNHVSGRVRGSLFPNLRYSIEPSEFLEFLATCPPTGCAATRVLGQTDFTYVKVGAAASSLGRNVASLAIDTVGNVYVADSGNSRVLEFRVVHHDLSATSPTSIRPPAGPRSCVVEGA